MIRYLCGFLLSAAAAAYFVASPAPVQAGGVTIIHSDGYGHYGNRAHYKKKRRHYRHGKRYRYDHKPRRRTVVHHRHYHDRADTGRYYHDERPKVTRHRSAQRHGCHRETIGAILGGAGGGLLGAQFGGGSGKLAATAAGTVIGILVGGSIGRTMDRVDQGCVGRTLEYGRTGKNVTWRGERGKTYAVKPTRTWRNPDGLPCREYQTTIYIDGEKEYAYGKACRRPDGTWRKVS